MPETNIANPPKPISPVIARTSLSLNHNDRLQLKIIHLQLEIKFL
jgi:hypothetical protein